MIVFPLVAAGVSLIFATMLLLEFVHDRARLPQLFWSVALFMFALASVVVAYGITQTWDASSYRIFWLFGVMLNVPWLALGSVALLRNKYITWASLGIVGAASVWGLVRTIGAKVCTAVTFGGTKVVCAFGLGPGTKAIFGHTDIPRGKDVWLSATGHTQSVYRLGILYSTLAYAVVILVAVGTSRARKGVEPPRRRRIGNLLIALGVTVVAIGGTSLSRFGRGAPFSVSLGLGAAVMFVGFLFTSRPARHTVVDPGSSPT